MITYTPIVGINIRDDNIGINYAELICKGIKTIETRNTNSLKPYINQRVRIIRTGIKNHKAQIIGEVTIGEPKIYYNKLEFISDYNKHFVPQESKFSIKENSIKYGYLLINPTLYEKYYNAVGNGIISRVNQPYIEPK